MAASALAPISSSTLEPVLQFRVVLWMLSWVEKGSPAHHLFFVCRSVEFRADSISTILSCRKGRRPRRKKLRVSLRECSAFNAS
jgi:hypothetical protein